MWKDKGLQLVMLPTENESKLSLDFYGRLFLGAYPKGTPLNQYLYLLSDEEIKEWDNYLDDCNDIRKAVTSVKEYWSNRSSYKKIIASTDPSLNLPQFPNAFIEEYVKRYNSKKSLEVEVEYMSNFISSNKWKIEFEELNTNDNTISIRFKEEKKPCTHEVVAEAMRIVSRDVRTPKVTYPFDIKHNGERMYSQAQMEMRLFEGIAHAISYPETFVTGICLDSTKTKNWIKENLK